MAADVAGGTWSLDCDGRAELAPFTSAEMDELGRLLGVREAGAGTLLMSESEPVECVAFILRGRVKLTRRHRGRRVVLQVLHPGDLYGDIPFLCGDTPPFEARALTDTEIVEMAPDAFHQLLEQRPAVTRRLLLAAASRLQRLQRRLLELTAGDLRHQLAALLMDEAGGDEMTLHLSQSTVAELLGATRPSVNRILKELEAEGTIALGYRRIDVLDPAALEGVATG